MVGCGEITRAGPLAKQSDDGLAVSVVNIAAILELGAYTFDGDGYAADRIQPRAMDIGWIRHIDFWLKAGQLSTEHAGYRFRV